MSGHVKSIDKNHLLEIGLEGFYGDSSKQSNPGNQLVGTDFISNNRIPEIDFTTIHLYPDQWISGSDDQAQATFVDNWIQSHIRDSDSVLRKPLLLTEFGKSKKSAGYSGGATDKYYETIYTAVYRCAKSGGACGGELFWQLMASGMDNFRDGYEVVLDESPSTAAIISKQSRRLSALN
ncbi:mannan endo-1,4-beta-mannosidase [Sarracenia purpurea var. burkii]